MSAVKLEVSCGKEPSSCAQRHSRTETGSVIPDIGAGENRQVPDMEKYLMSEETRSEGDWKSPWQSD